MDAALFRANTFGGAAKVIAKRRGEITDMIVADHFGNFGNAVLAVLQ